MKLELKCYYFDGLTKKIIRYVCNIPILLVTNRQFEKAKPKIIHIWIFRSPDTIATEDEVPEIALPPHSKFENQPKIIPLQISYYPGTVCWFKHKINENKSLYVF